MATVSIKGNWAWAFEEDIAIYHMLLIYFSGLGVNIRSIVIVTVLMILMMFAVHCTWVTSNAYSSPSIVLASYKPDGSRDILDECVNGACSWLKHDPNLWKKYVVWSKFSNVDCWLWNIIFRSGCWVFWLVWWTIKSVRKFCLKLKLKTTKSVL